mmetsp:Transcript_27465/g.38811  ORF Transcript_27465/g.38811 Transcript_27465/m.38811 type:complete len:92 (+) Transcript_27465:571-846(+)
MTQLKRDHVTQEKIVQKAKARKLNAEAANEELKSKYQVLMYRHKLLSQGVDKEVVDMQFPLILGSSTISDGLVALDPINKDKNIDSSDNSE